MLHGKSVIWSGGFMDKDIEEAIRKIEKTEILYGFKDGRAAVIMEYMNEAKAATVDTIQKVLEEKGFIDMTRQTVTNLLTRKLTSTGLLDRTKRGQVYIYFLKRDSQEQKL
jgi:predicted transcriptional regulator